LLPVWEAAMADSNKYRIGKNGEVLLDYSVYDALRSGFGKVVFIIRHDIEQDFRKIVLDRMNLPVPYELVFQKMDSIVPPELAEYASKTGRTKPWGTTHALLCAAKYLDAPFAVINADDFYGREAFQIMGDYLSTQDLKDGSIVPYRLNKTLSPKGTVTRGLCVIENDYLVSVDELKSIEKQGDIIINTDSDGKQQELPARAPVSMNFWGLPPDCLVHISRYFDNFCEKLGKEAKSECYIPLAVDWLVRNKLLKIKSLAAQSEWFGVTYQEDRAKAERRVTELINAGIYPPGLWN
jgi:hypothetical protein